MHSANGAVPELSIVIPVFNEADAIVGLLREIHAALTERVRFEVVVVDDGSTDQTLAVLRAHRAESAVLRIVGHETNAGQSTALQTGIGVARAVWVATLDGDGQNDPADILTLTTAAEKKPALKLICGNRQRRHDSWLRRFASRVANSVRAGVLGDATPDTGCGLKLIHRETFLQLPGFDNMHRFLPALFQQAGHQTISVPVNHRERSHGESKYGIHDRLWVGIVDLFGVVWLGRRNRTVAFEEITKNDD